MKIRDFQTSDIPPIRKLYTTQGYGFQFPDLEHPLVLVKKCVVDERDLVHMAAFGRLHISALMFVDPAWRTPLERYEAVKRLQEAMIAEAGEKYGLDMATTQMEGRFAERMKDQGWYRGWGEMYYREF